MLALFTLIFPAHPTLAVARVADPDSHIKQTPEVQLSHIKLMLFGHACNLQMADMAHGQVLADFLSISRASQSDGGVGIFRPGDLARQPAQCFYASCLGDKKIAECRVR